MKGVHRAKRDPRHHAGARPSSHERSFRSGAGVVPVAPLPTRRQPPTETPPASNSTPSEHRHPPPKQHSRCVKVGVSQVRKSGCLLTPGRPALSTGPPPADPRYRPDLPRQTRVIDRTSPGRFTLSTGPPPADPRYRPDLPRQIHVIDRTSPSRPALSTGAPRADPRYRPDLPQPNPVSLPVPIHCAAGSAPSRQRGYDPHAFPCTESILTTCH